MPAPGAPAAGGEDAAATGKVGQLMKSCWSCRMVSGGGLVLCGAYVFQGARKVMARSGYTSIGTVAQITFAASLAAWGIVILTDPVGKGQRKT